MSDPNGSLFLWKFLIKLFSKKFAGFEWTASLVDLRRGRNTLAFERVPFLVMALLSLGEYIEDGFSSVGRFTYIFYSTLSPRIPR